MIWKQITEKNLEMVVEMNKVAVIGSLNIDTTLEVVNFPHPGQTVKAINKSSTAGGKGANQAVAAARSQAQTSFIGKVGADQQGKFMIAAMQEEGIETSGIKVEQEAGTGTAAIMLDQRGQNSIIVYGGANSYLTAADVQAAAPQITAADFAVAQFETPQAATIEAFKLAKQNGVTTILNPAPAAKLVPELLGLTDIIIPNESESQQLTDIAITDLASLERSVAKFASWGIACSIITLGEKGVFYSFKGKTAKLDAFKVKAVDTTAAGDTFIGAFAAQLLPSLENFVTAIDYAQKASALTVQHLGAQVSIPTVSEIMGSIQLRRGS